MPAPPSANSPGAPAAAPASARAVARRELTRAIIEEARRQLAAVGPAALSVRSVARELGMASSAVYRYFATRDELLTALIVIAYEEVGDLVETAEAAVPRPDLLGRWLTLTRAFRGWAVAHPHDYALLYGSPVPGYAAPSDTVEPAIRVVRLALAILADAAGSGATEPPLPLPPTVAAAVAPIRAIAGPAFTDDLTYRALVAWSGVIGAVTLELFGHLHNGVVDFDTWFTEAMRRLAPLPVDADGDTHGDTDALRSRS